MPVIDDLEFRLKTIKNRMIRINAVANDVEKKPTDEKNCNLLKVMTTNLDDLFSEFFEVGNKLASLYIKQTPATDVDINEEFASFEELYYNIKAIALSNLSSDLKSSTLPLLSNSGIENSSTGVRLPKLTLLRFSGNIMEWQPFYDLFLTSVHNQLNISDVQKFMYLKAQLEGNALSLISSLPITAANYKVAWEVLTKTYQDTNRLTTAYLEAMFDFPTINAHPKQLRSMYSLITEYVGALGALGHVVENWSVLLLFMFKRKLSPNLRERWETQYLTLMMPEVKDFLHFLETEVKILEASKPTTLDGYAGKSGLENKVSKLKKPFGGPTSLVATSLEKNKLGRCPCKCGHSLRECDKFLKMSVGSRLNFVKYKGYCVNCLDTAVKRHYIKNCQSDTVCSCGGRHNEILCFKKHAATAKPNEYSSSSVDELSHGASQSKVVVLENQTAESKNNNVSVASMQTLATRKGFVVLLATARVYALDVGGTNQIVKVLIDSASQGTFVSNSCVKRLGLPLKAQNTPIFGFGQSKAGVSKGLVNIQIKSILNPEIKLNIDALVVDHITQCSKLSCHSINWSNFENLNLADPYFYKDQAIDILLGAEWYGRIVTGAPILGQHDSPDVMNTIFGHCLLGRMECDQSFTVKNTVLCTTFGNNLECELRHFWELEEPPTYPRYSKNEEQCELHYTSNVTRRDGRYIVKLPFLKSNPELGSSYSLARRRFELLERRLKTNPELREKYNEFMRTYLLQGHMVPTTLPPSNGKVYYIPHHCIYRNNQGFSRFRVVFDCSMKTTNGISLNQQLHIGPKLQLNIVDILFRFRLHNVCVVADIRQMYRAIGVHESDFDFQRIFWRFNPDDVLKEYCLTTVTYGNAAAPFLAIRTLHQLVKDEGKPFPAASKAILENTFMDDTCCSVESLREAQNLQTELTELLSRGKFTLRKWLSNRPELLTTVPAEDCAIDPNYFSFHGDDDPGTAILGLAWNPVKDIFTFKVRLITGCITKRTILSAVARLYDPLGFLSPITFYGKWIIQHLWHLGLDWDDRPPDDLVAKWLQFEEELPLLAEIEFPRCIRLDSGLEIQLHGFCDSSERGYAAVVYIRVEHSNKPNFTSLLIAKSKVAPLKRVTLPRLELCGAVLVSKLLHYAKCLLKEQCNVSSITAWSDSMVALHWIKSSPHKWKSFIGNRISQIHERVSPNNFRYVPSSTNPADLGSRGALPKQFIANPLWKNGPNWLNLSEENWPKDLISKGTNGLPEINQEERVITLHTQLRDCPDWITRFSSFSQLRRFLAYWMRYLNYLRNPRNKQFSLNGPTSDEIKSATLRLVSVVQQMEFTDEINCLKRNGLPSSKLKKLNPFLDADGLIRVGGRLANAEISENRKHPLLLSKSHHLTHLIIDYFHILYLHAGPLQLHYIIQCEFWILNARQIIRHRLLRCLKCFRTKPKMHEPKMGELPASRLEAISPFNISGVDYGGPYNITMTRIRKANILKAYICLFVCFATKAIHLELVSDLTSDAFLAALRRFVARRGTVTELHSDCGTNFVGAKRKLEEWNNVVSTKPFNDLVQKEMSEKGIIWKLTAPGSPHLNGLIEAGIKSCKRHLSRVIGFQVLTYEEFYTVLVQIESILNSRPITAVSTDPNDLTALTPGHLLMQRPAYGVVHPPDSGKTLHLNHRWKLLQQIVHSFWKRWQAQYLSTLQIRQKWTKSVRNLTPGDLVIIKLPNLPPCQWKLGRVVNVFPGKDNIVRVADVRTSNGLFKRAVTQLCLLPNQT